MLLSKFKAIFSSLNKEKNTVYRDSDAKEFKEYLEHNEQDHTLENCGSTLAHELWRFHYK